MALNKNGDAENFGQYRFHERFQKFICNVFSKKYAKGTLNINSRATHLSNDKFTRKFIRGLYKQASIDVTDANVSNL